MEKLIQGLSGWQGVHSLSNKDCEVISSVIYSKCTWLIGMIQMNSNIDKGMNQQMKIVMTMDKKLQHWRSLGLEEQILRIQLKSILEGTTLMVGTFTVKGTKEVVDIA